MSNKVKATNCDTCSHRVKCRITKEYTTFVNAVKAASNTTGNLDLKVKIRCNRS